MLTSLRIAMLSLRIAIFNLIAMLTSLQKNLHELSGNDICND